MDAAFEVRALFDIKSRPCGPLPGGSENPTAVVRIIIQGNGSRWTS